MRYALRRAVTGTPGILFMGSVGVLGVSALAWGLWSPNEDIGSMGLMSIEPRPAVTTSPPAASRTAPSAVQEPAERETLAARPVEVPIEPAVERPAEPEPEAAPAYDGPTFDGRPLRPVRQMGMRVTAYSPDEQSCGKWADGWTASGYSVWTNGMKLVAADTSILPFGTLVSIPGYNNGEPVEVLDVGGAIKGNRLDVLYPTHQRALQWGVQDLEVTVWEYAD